MSQRKLNGEIVMKLEVEQLTSAEYITTETSNNQHFAFKKNVI